MTTQLDAYGVDAQNFGGFPADGIQQFGAYAFLLQGLQPTTPPPNIDNTDGKFSAQDVEFGAYSSVFPELLQYGNSSEYHAYTVPTGAATAPPVILAEALPDGTVDASYSKVLTASGGNPPYEWQILSGSFPPGLVMGRFTGIISGVPTQVGVYTFTVLVNDDAGQQDTEVFTITVRAARALLNPLRSKLFLNETVDLDFIVSNPTTGAATDADLGYPDIEIYEDASGVALPYTPAAAKRAVGTTGQYTTQLVLSAANGFEVGKWYNVYAIAAVGGVVGKMVLETFKIESKLTYTG